MCCALPACAMLSEIFTSHVLCFYSISYARDILSTLRDALSDFPANDFILLNCKKEGEGEGGYRQAHACTPYSYRRSECAARRSAGAGCTQCPSTSYP
jgi:hypothetical protein